jgi:hypothetical protein
MDQPGKFAMRHAYILVVVVVLLCSNSLLAEPSAQSGMSDKAAIEQLFDRYVQAYSAKDYAKLREQLQAPFLRFPASVEVLPTIDDVMNYYRTQRDGLDQQNYGRSQFINSRIRVLLSLGRLSTERIGDIGRMEPFCWRHPLFTW